MLSRDDFSYRSFSLWNEIACSKKKLDTSVSRMCQVFCQNVSRICHVVKDARTEDCVNFIF